MSHEHTITAPNTCGCTVESQTSTVCGFFSGTGVVIACPDDIDEFFQFETIDQCWNFILQTDPACSKNLVYGSIVIDVASNQPYQFDAAPGTDITFELICSCPEAPTANLSYKWYLNNTLLATTPSYTWTTPNDSGNYSLRVEVTAEDSNDWSGFNVKNYSINVN